MGFRLIRVPLLAAAIGAFALQVAPASASINVGQTGDPVGSDCDADIDLTQVSVVSGNSFTVPETGTITSWTMFAAGPAGQQYTMKVFRKIAEPLTYQVVGHAGPQVVTPGGTAGNTFPANIQVKPGDVLGLHSFADHNRCAVIRSGDVFAALLGGDLADGESQPFVTASVGHANIEATLVPDNAFRIAKTKRNRKKGNAVLTLELPNPGTLSGSGGGAKVAKSKTVAPGQAKLTVKAKGLKSRTLNSDGKVKLSVQVIYTPTGGDPLAKKLKVKLLKN